MILLNRAKLEVEIKERVNLMKKSKARKVLNVLEGMSPEQQKTWLVENRYATAESDKEFQTAYNSIVSAAEL